MIYASVNELGVRKADWVAGLPIGAKWVTRRSKPQPLFRERAVCPGRGKKAVARGEVISCESHLRWKERLENLAENTPYAYLLEARREGFKSTNGWLAWYPAHGLDINKTFRIEQRKVA